MSYSAMKWAMEVHATPTQKHVLLVLATHANEDGEAFPSIQSVCNATGLSDRAVRKARSELIAVGLLEKSSKFTRNGVRLNMARHAAHPAPDAGPHNSQLNTINNHTIPPTPQPKKSTASKAKPVQPKIELPDWMPVEAWDGWLEMRRNELKKPAGRRAQELAVKKLATLRDQGHGPEAVLDQSTMANWQGLFPVKPDRTGPLPHNVTPFPSRMSRDEENRRASLDFLKGISNG